MGNYVNISNRVEKDTLRAVQLKTMETLKDILSKSFGPMGSTTIIRKNGAFNRYTKDGHTIIDNINFKGEIEESVREDIEALTRHTVLGLGDSSTSIVLLSAILFKHLARLEAKSTMPPADLIAEFKKYIEDIIKIIRSNGRDCTLDDIYNIALISTNNDEDLAQRLKVVYEECGMGVFIDVTTSNTDETYLKMYDGLTLEAGYSENAFINDIKRGVCSIRNPEIFAFEDPIDTPEMMSFVDQIIFDNIYKHYTGAEGTSPKNVVPTVIFCPKISKDLSAFMEQLVDWIGKLQGREKPPICIVTNIYDAETFMDISKLCGCKIIKKYLDPRLQNTDIEKGLAPTPETIHNFAGAADVVESDLAKTKVINPKLMHDENGELTPLFNSMVDYLEAELKKAIVEGEDLTVRGNLKRRINALKANMVEICVGGVTVADRDSRRDLLEDAVLNCRSAAANGVGYGANFEGLRAALQIARPELNLEHISKSSNNDVNDAIIEFYNNYDRDNIKDIIAASYIELGTMLYNTIILNQTSALATLTETLRYINGGITGPLNIRTKNFDKTVLSSIESDVVVLTTISQILTLMITSNQFLLPSHLNNLYDQVEPVEF